MAEHRPSGAKTPTVAAYSCPSCRANVVAADGADATRLTCPACRTVFSQGPAASATVSLAHGADPPPAAAETTESWSPEFLARYEVLRLLGQGGMGSVYLARERQQARMVAVKVLRSMDPDARKRFVREAKALSLISHPHTLTVYDFGEAGDQPYLVCEYIDGETLADRIQREGPIPLERAGELAQALLSALDHAHGKGIVHRDVKPANVLLPKSGGLKLADFGLAKGAEKGGALESLTATGTIMGTPAYMSPEQVKGERPGKAADIYSAGLVIYEMVTGRAPFAAASPLEVMGMHVRQPPPDPREVRRELPVDAANAIQKAMAKRPGERWESCAAFGAELQRTLDVARPETPSASTPEDRAASPPDPVLRPDPIEIELANLDSPDAGVRRAAVFACARAVEIRAIPRLRAIARQDDSIEIRYLARKSLWLMTAQKPDRITEELSSQATVNLLLDPNSSEAIMRQLMSDKPQARGSALRAAATTASRDPRLLEFLLIRVDEERVPELRALLVTVLGALGSARELPLIARFLQEEHPATRANAVEALDMLRDPTAYAIIIKTLQDPHPQVRAKVVAVLQRLGKLNILKCCRAMLGSGELWLREAAAFCLSASVFPDAIPVLELALRDGHEPVRLRAIKALRQLAQAGHTRARELVESTAGTTTPEDAPSAGPPPSLASVRSGNFGSPDLDERRQAVQTLTIMGADESQIADLTKQLEIETDEQVVVSLLTSLGKSKRPEAAPAIRNRLGHRSTSVRAAAISALSDLADPASMAAILPLLDDASVDVASKAILALEGYHEAQSLQALEKLAASPDPAHRRAAVLVASEMREARHRRVLSVLARDRDESVANTAREACDMQGPEPAATSAESADQPQTPPATEHTESPSVGTPPGAGERSSARMTGRVPAVTPGPTSRVSGTWKLPTRTKPEAPPPPTGAVALLKQSPALTAGLLVSVFTIGGVTAAMIVRPEASRSRPAQGKSAAPFSELASIASAPDVTRFVGRLVQWSGTLKELNPDRNRLLVESGGQFFAARCEAPVNDAIKPGTRVDVQGLVIERNQGVVILQGRDVKVAGGPPPGPSARR